MEIEPEHEPVLGLNPYGTEASTAVRQLFKVKSLKREQVLFTYNGFQLLDASPIGPCNVLGPAGSGVRGYVGKEFKVLIFVINLHSVSRLHLWCD